MNVERYFVTRVHPDLPPNFLPPEWEGRWWPLPEGVPIGENIYDPISGVPLARFVQTDRFERRCDGLTARVYEIWPAVGRRGFVQPDGLPDAPA